ncbi:MAG TPA: hypothetical protein DEG17_11635 [Cyanobacteria bacterium UBA11149]|nr:hypothetical protein [Cyanobacteria bacterium UBA11366]HBK62075.1 hypothetical protein [Cyanobacteria bacterium UBA11166]HBR74878.1 hypothetical protein [Cyanobacteria bacterium UBA11159]HBS70886.1 hypothetical protein [Cyanobacteria bacterium UBA11153]HBW89499.1 hypothetical protein [Cyanobacteria bacterium UBA11149]HCA94960.1 hypothetical protein [Cyanobacteria bacterium UBA9226]
MLISWKPEQILALAPDTTLLKDAIDLATSQKWQEIGTNNRVAWGNCHVTEKQHYQTQIDLKITAWQCTCNSKKLPCQHILALYLILVKNPHLFSHNQPPDWVEDWLESCRQKQAKKTESETIVDPLAQAKRAAKREKNVTAATEELDFWLRDLVRVGLARLSEKDRSFWETTAARMVDNQARLLARQIRIISNIDRADIGWTEELLKRLGMLHLLLEGFTRRNTLAPGSQADILTRIDWEFDKQLGNGISLRDSWLILGQRIEEIKGEKDLVEATTWLWGSESQKYALISNSTHISKPLETNLFPGTCFDGELVFFQSGYPLRAIIKQHHSPLTPFSHIPGDKTITAALSEYTKALSCQPWIERFPIALQAVIPQKYQNGWVLRDSQNHILPIAPNFDRFWELLAISGGNPINIFGEWNSHCFLPLSTLAEECFIKF